MRNLCWNVEFLEKAFLKLAQCARNLAGQPGILVSVIHLDPVETKHSTRKLRCRTHQNGVNFTVVYPKTESKIVSKQKYKMMCTIRKESQSMWGKQIVIFNLFLRIFLDIHKIDLISKRWKHMPGSPGFSCSTCVWGTRSSLSISKFLSWKMFIFVCFHQHWFSLIVRI